ncbi:hypothetical protein ABHN84_13790 [Shewanella vesiculosa]|uniref:Uncharacterized protein n=1 Tax=Shewanella vesiculosa TaxID=518738 RepID=A0ABV0FR88_9GAMM
MEIDFSKVIPVSDMKGQSDRETEELNAYLVEAIEEVDFYTWHDGILKSYFGLGIGGIYAVFLFEVAANREDVDNFIWVVVGDLLTAYITSECAPNPACALDGYIGAMEEWVEAALTGKSVKDLIPVNTLPTIANGKSLKTRLEFLDQNVLVNYQPDLES